MLKILVTQDKFNEVVDLADSFNLGQVKIAQAYEYLCEFIVDENGAYVGREKADKMFREAHVKRGEIGTYWLDFVQKTQEAFLPKASGETSDEP